MTLVAGLYKQYRVDGKRISQQEPVGSIGLLITPEEKRRSEKAEIKMKEQQEKAAKDQDRQRKKRTPFDFEKVLFFSNLFKS